MCSLETSKELLLSWNSVRNWMPTVVLGNWMSNEDTEVLVPGISDSAFVDDNSDIDWEPAVDFENDDSCRDQVTVKTGNLDSD